jgi:hypothetical protein
MYYLEWLYIGRRNANFVIESSELGIIKLDDMAPKVSPHQFCPKIDEVLANIDQKQDLASYMLYHSPLLHKHHNLIPNMKNNSD